MTGDCHVRICGSPGVRFPRATRPLRGVLKTCWRLGLMDAETYARAADVANVRAKTLPSGRAGERDEVRALFAACDDSPAGRRDAAMLAILYGGGLRRAELCGLDLADFDAGGCALTVRAGKGRRDRVVYLSKPACALVKKWLSARDRLTFSSSSSSSRTLA